MSDLPRPRNTFCRRTRREFLWQAGGGFAATALAGLLSVDGFFNAQANAADGVREFKPPLAPKPPHFTPKAKSVIFLFMYGGPSHIDTFDHKPAMKGMDGKTVTVKTFGRGGHRNEGRIVEPRWSFRQYGKSGQWVSDLFPHLATCVDEIAFLKSMTADSPIHGSAMLMMNSGRILSGSPCIGSWINYGLGSVNQNLPGFVVMLDPTGGPISGAKNWSSGFMPATYQGVIMRSSGAPIFDLNSSEAVTPEMQRTLLAISSTKRIPSTWPRDQIIQSLRPASPAMSWRSRCSGTRPRRWMFRKRAKRHSSCMEWTTHKPKISAASACWPGGSWSGACGLFRFMLAAIITTPTGTLTATWRRTTTTTLAAPINPSPG
jgi:hypothetical protein